MIERTVKIVNKAGLHTRPAATIVKMAAKFKCEFFIGIVWPRPSQPINGMYRREPYETQTACNYQSGFWASQADSTHLEQGL